MDELIDCLLHSQEIPHGPKRNVRYIGDNKYVVFSKGEYHIGNKKLRVTICQPEERDMLAMVIIHGRLKRDENFQKHIAIFEYVGKYPPPCRTILRTSRNRTRILSVLTRKATQNIEEHTPRPMPSPGRTPYRGPMLSPSPTSASDRSDPISRQSVAISTYLKDPKTGKEGAYRHKDPHMVRMNERLDQRHGKLKTMVLNFTTHLARKHRERTISLQVWQAWRSTIEAKWKEKVEKACQKKAQEVCVQLTDEYEEKIKEPNALLRNARNEVAGLHKERQKYEETMKKAFMRGLCALNLEAMSMSEGGEGQPGPSEVETLAAAVEALQSASDGNNPGASFKFHQARKPDYVHSDFEPTRLPYDTASVTIDYSGPANRPVSGGGLAKGSVVTGKNYQTEQPLSHAVKYPYTPTKEITATRGPFACDGQKKKTSQKGLKS